MIRVIIKEMMIFQITLCNRVQMLEEMQNQKNLQKNKMNVS